MVILIDNGHGCNTSGKCSPDGKLKEWKWTREAAKMLLRKLQEEGIEARLVTPEDHDVSLNERVKRVNEVSKALGSANVMLISLHLNAAGNGQSWMEASGFSVYVSPNASDYSKLFAQTLTKKAEELSLMGNRSVPSSKYWKGDFFILKYTKCPAVLTENLFMDNKEDAKLLMSAKGMDKLTNLHVKSIKNYMRWKEDLR